MTAPAADVKTSITNLVAEIEKLPRASRWAVADFVEDSWGPPTQPTRGTAMWLAFVELVRAVDAEQRTAADARLAQAQADGAEDSCWQEP